MRCGCCKNEAKLIDTCSKCGRDMCEFCRLTKHKDCSEDLIGSYFRPKEDPTEPSPDPRGKYFALIGENGDEIGFFRGKQPRQAALKAACRGYIDIRLRERGTKKLHVFVGERVQTEKPKNAPAWMPGTIWKPNVKKICVEKMEKF